MNVAPRGRPLRSAAAHRRQDGAERPLHQNQRVAARVDQRAPPKYEKLLSFEKRRDSYEFLLARNPFYRALAEIPDNGELKRFLTALHVHLLRVQVRNYDSLDDLERFDDYRQIGEAVKAGNPRKAELAGRRHVRRIAAALEKLPDRAYAAERGNPGV